MTPLVAVVRQGSVVGHPADIVPDAVAKNGTWCQSCASHILDAVASWTSTDSYFLLECSDCSGFSTVNQFILCRNVEKTQL